MEVTIEIIDEKLDELRKKKDSLSKQMKELEDEMDIWQGMKGIVAREDAELPIAQKYKQPSDFLQPWLKDQHLSQADLATLMDMSPAVVSRWVTGKVVPMPRARYKLVNIVCQYDKSLHTEDVMKLFDSWWRKDDGKEAL